MLVTLTRLDGQPCVLVGQDRLTRPAPRPGPAALREARRGMRLAEELGLPLVTVIDTPGAELSPAAEEGAIAGEIARCIAALTTMTVPTVSVILGQGCGGGALALLPAQVVIATENAWLSPLPPEGASVIRFGDIDHAAEMAESQGIGAAALVESRDRAPRRTRAPRGRPRVAGRPPSLRRSPTSWWASALSVVEEGPIGPVSKPLDHGFRDAR